MWSSASLLAILLACAGANAADIKPEIARQLRGVPPSLYGKYNSSGQFQCLDGSQTLPSSSVNDDYCDCADGSDEPGTAACEGLGTKFYCANTGHLPGWVLSSRVNDGICDPECCDGSDEWATGACPNRCEEIGREYRARVELEQKTRKTGAKIRGTYIKYAGNEKKRLVDEITKKESEVKAKEAELERAKVALDRAESRSHEALEKRKQSPLYVSLLSHRLALTRLRDRVRRLEEESRTLNSILDELSKGYNPNGQDMAVKAAVVGYQEFINPPSTSETSHDEIASPGGDASTSDNVDGEIISSTTSTSVEDVEEEITDRELEQLERKDLVGLLMQDMEANEDDEEDEEGGGLLYRIDEYIPDMFYESWAVARDFVIDWFVKLGILGRGTKAAPKSAGDTPHVAAAREKHRNLQNEVNRLNNDVRDSRDTLSKLEGYGYGVEGEWKKLDGTCISTVSGDYTYELCFFGRVTQKSNKDHSSNHLGNWGEWKPYATPGSYDSYTVQRYINGAKCWNGPMRSATVEFTCGKENALLSMSEPEKCEYQFKATSPALCWPLEEVAADAAGGEVAEAPEAVVEPEVDLDVKEEL